MILNWKIGPTNEGIFLGAWIRVGWPAARVSNLTHLLANKSLHINSRYTLQIASSGLIVAVRAFSYLLESDGIPKTALI